LTKAIRMVFVHVDGDVVSGMAACQPVVLVCALCCGRMDTVSILPQQSAHTNTRTGKLPEDGSCENRNMSECLM
jgi:hypothetical protein